MIPKKLTRPVRCELDYPIVNTPKGILRGADVDGVFCFRGITYGNANRFEAPAEPESWEGIKPALNYGMACAEIRTRLPEWDGFGNPSWWYPQGEHCQNLNIWTKHINEDAMRPVFVWLNNNSNLFVSDGFALAEYADAVVVSVNHRTGILGFLNSGMDVAQENCGNFALADIVQALRWIKENISSFGGNPEHVMIAGHNKLPLAILQCPAADGLYSSVSIQGDCSICGVKDSESKEMAQFISDELEDTDSIKTISFFRLAKAAVKAETRWLKKYMMPFRWEPIICDSYFSGHPFSVGFRHETKNTTVVMGNTLGGRFSNIKEMSTANTNNGHKNDWNMEVIQGKCALIYAEHSIDLINSFAGAYPNANVSDALFTDYVERRDILKLCKMRVESALAPCYNWILTQQMPADGGSTPWERLETAFIFHQADRLEAAYQPGETESLQDEMASDWIAIASGTVPQNWAAVRKNTVNTKIYDTQSYIARDHDTELIKLSEKYIEQNKSITADGFVGGGARAER